VSCLNQTLDTDNVTPTNYEFYVNNTTPSSVGLINFDRDAIIATTQVTLGFDAYYQIFNGNGVLVTFIQVDDPTKWVTYRGTIILPTSLSTFFQIKSPGLQYNSTSFIFINGKSYCIYISVEI